MNLPSSWTARKAFAAALLTSSALAATLQSRPAHAQLFNQFLPENVSGEGIEPDVTVTSRLRTDYQNAGVHAGAFTIRPLVTESYGYESNVLGLARARGSTLLETNASLDATTDNSRGSVNTGLSVSDNRYLDLASQSYTTWNARLGGTYNLGRDSATILVSHQNLAQTQRDLDVPQLDAPLPYTIDTARLGYQASFSRLTFTPSFEVARYRFNSGFSGNTIYDQSYRNRTSLTPTVVAAYEFATRRSVVLVVRNTTAFFSTGTAFFPKRDFNDTSVLGGVDYDLNGIFRLRALVGYESRSFSSAAYETISAPIAEVSLIYIPTGLTTITGTVARRIQDSADETIAAVRTLSATLKVDHELRRNILLTAGAGLSQNEYSLDNGSQTQYTANAGATYLLNRYASVGATYDLIVRTGNTTAVNLNGFAAASNFTDHRFLLQLKLAL